MPTLGYYWRIILFATQNATILQPVLQGFERHALVLTRYVTLMMNYGELDRIGPHHLPITVQETDH
jgi:hypothetical protein